MKSPQRMSDAGSIPATSTTTGVSGFDGMLSVDGQFATVPAAPGSAESRRPGNGPNPSCQRQQLSPADASRCVTFLAAGA